MTDTKHIGSGVNDPEWHDNTPTPFEIAYYALNHAVKDRVVHSQEADDSKTAIKALLAERDQLRAALKTAVRVMQDHNIDEARAGEFDQFTDALNLVPGVTR
jgi:hypothetical protein